MKKLLILICFIFLCLPVFAARDYYIRQDKEYQLEFLCFSKDECYCTTPDIIDIKNKKFVGFGGYHYFDTSTYKYDKITDTYTVDVMVNRDPSSDLEVCNKCPYDSGYITHLIFKLSYTPSKKLFKSDYKGFVSSKEVTEYQNGKPMYIYTKFLNLYYNSDPQLISDLNVWKKFFKEISKKFGTQESSNYDIEIEYILPRYLH